MTVSSIYAGRLERFIANLIDTAILVVLAGMAATFFISTDTSGKAVMAPVSLLVIFLLNAAYYTAFISSSWQASPGQRIMNMYVRKVDGRKLTQRDALERFLAYALPGLPMYASFLPESVAPMLAIWLSVFWFAPILTHPQRAGLHDKLCHTRVVTGRINP